MPAQDTTYKHFNLQCRYEAKAPKEIKFVPLNQVKEYNAQELMELYSVSEYILLYC